MPPSTRRIPKKLFEFIYKGKKTIRHFPLFSVTYGNLPEGPSRFACISSKKAENKAFRRVKARRACYRALWSLEKVVPNGTFIIVSPKKGFGELTPQLIEDSLKKALSELRIIAE